MTSLAPAEFGAALRAAIERSGLSLSEISRRLRDQETPVSVSALSYWQNGENRPERASSLAAVTALETILGQRPETLTGLLGPRRPRGRWTIRADTALPYDQVWRRPEEVARALAKMDVTPDELDTPNRLSQYLSYRVDGEGHQESVRVRRLIRADHDGTSRFVFVNRCSSITQPPAVLFAEGCRPARFRADVPSSTCVFEFALDRTLAAGELAVVEFGVRFPPGQARKHVQIALYRPARDVAVQIVFDPKRLPRRCAGFFRPRGSMPPEERCEATFDRDTSTFQFITLDPQPGQYGIQWSWT
ncbi:XRE family transcriptional regulator [Amycolatopsis sp. WAC 01416]|uniref:helix-turn-helix domain-containing protein n=1 Tax=Amycolatopsis sp. WAC 01416 TaxID=2203196 RepID=UPI000F78CC2F|nr:helix-turn-helix transcriptional regulator [Amycolatopsis sp. WAC 01416]RSN27403.1 XRE family transcriptional regulator [Amycolatopsis sp. WAC 01416]